MEKRMRQAMVAMLVVAAAVVVQAEDGPFTVDFSRTVGRIKPLNGMCNAAPIYNTQTKGLEEEVRNLRIPFYRFHDAAHENPGYALVDVSRVFPLFNLDPDDPGNYDFRATDDYLRPCVEAGAKIEFRLGESIEHARVAYRTNPPADLEKWAEICAHVVRHYNAGWADGHRWGIGYWSVWEEPNNPELFTGTDSYERVYFPLYSATVRRLKREFPDLKVGGPNSMGAWGAPSKFVDYCQRSGTPLDFLSWTQYSRKPEQFAERVRFWRKYLDERGFAKTELFISEWHFGPLSWSGHGSINAKAYAREWERELTSMPAVAFTDALLIRMQDEPVDAMFFYSMLAGCWGVFDADRSPNGHYHALRAFAELARGENRVAAETCPAPGWYLLASKDGEGRGRVLLSALHAEGYRMPQLRLKGNVKPVSVKVIDAVRAFEEVPDWTWDGNVLFIPRLCSDSSIWLVETEFK